MSHHDLTRWIEDADARQFNEAVLFEGRLEHAAEPHRHLGDAIAALTSWFRPVPARREPRFAAPTPCSALASVRHYRKHD